MIVGRGISSFIPIVGSGGGASVPDPVSFWNADNSTADAFGVNPLTLVNGTTYDASGLINQAFIFDGVNDYATAGDDKLSVSSLNLVCDTPYVGM